MIWYGGGLTNAVQQVKCTKSMLLAFIYEHLNSLNFFSRYYSASDLGLTPTAAKLAKHLESIPNWMRSNAQKRSDDKVSERYRTYFAREFPKEPLSYIAIQIHQNSVAYEQFKKIYIKVPVPSVFLVGPDGRPMSIVCTEDPRRLTEALQNAAEQLKSFYSRASEEPVKVNNTPEDEEPQNDKPEKPILSAKARIQFRLPTDEVRAWDFPSKSTLQDVKLFLMETARIRPGFKLVRTYPRATFTPEDEAKTLEDLALTPSAALVVVPVQRGIHASIKNLIAKNTLLSTFFAALFKPVFSIVNYFRRLLSSPGSGKFEQERRRRYASKRFCRKSPSENIHSFAFDDSDTDSDMNTDNGNSTLQM